MSAYQRFFFSLVITLVLTGSTVIGETATFTELKSDYLGKSFYLQHNLWYRDEGECSWFNFILQGHRQKIGTRVTITKFKVNTIQFVTESGSITFQLSMRHSDSSFETVLKRIFGNDPPNLEGMSEIDRKGIELGRIYEGMTRRAVFFAVGYPPLYSPDRNPGSSGTEALANGNVHAPKLTYWKNRWDRIIVSFDDHDVITHIQD